MDTNNFSIATLSKSSSEIRQENKTFLREEQERFKRLYKYKIVQGQLKQLGKGGNGAVLEGVEIQSNVARKLTLFVRKQFLFPLIFF